MTAPHRPATSTIRPPNTPFTQISTLSPGSTRFANTVSMPADPVPLIAIVISFFVRNTSFSFERISSINCRNTGSRCPIVGLPNASNTRAGVSEGPGPSRIR